MSVTMVHCWLGGLSGLLLGWPQCGLVISNLHMNINVHVNFWDVSCHESRRMFLSSYIYIHTHYSACFVSHVCPCVDNINHWFQQQCVLFTLCQFWEQHLVNSLLAGRELWWLFNRFILLFKLSPELFYIVLASSHLSMIVSNCVFYLHTIGEGDVSHYIQQYRHHTQSTGEAKVCVHVQNTIAWIVRSPYMQITFIVNS